jgi:hypothetical protein
MDGLQPVSPETSAPAPSAQPASGTSSGRMSIKDAARAAVQSLSHSSSSSAAPASAPDEPDDTVPDAPPATAPGDGGPVIPTDASAIDGAETTAAKAEDARSLPGTKAPDPEKSGPLEAPSRWPAEERATFSRLPDDAKRILLEREKRFNTAYTQATQELAKTREKYDHLASAFTPELRSQMSRSGLDERGAIGYLVQYHQLYETNPVAYVQAAIQAKGLTPQQVFPQLAAAAQPSPTAPAPAEDDWLDPAVIRHTQTLTQPLNQELETVKRTLAELQTAHRNAQQQAELHAQREQQAMLQSLEEVVSAFAGATDEAGTPRYPHLDQVFDQMMHLMSTDPGLQAMPVARAQDKLERAYEMAVRLHPELYQLEIDRLTEQRLAALKKREDEARAAEAAARAKRAQTVRPQPGSQGGSVTPGRMSIRDAAKKAVVEHYR